MKETTKRLLRDVTKITQKMQLCLELCVAKVYTKRKPFLQKKPRSGLEGKEKMKCQTNAS